MLTAFWYPDDPVHHGLLQPTFVIERLVIPQADLFVEYVGDTRHTEPLANLSIRAVLTASPGCSKSTSI